MKRNILKENMRRFNTKNLDEAYAWERKPGKPLPTLNDTTKQHQSNINEQSSMNLDLFAELIDEDFMPSGNFSTINEGGRTYILLSFKTRWGEWQNGAEVKIPIASNYQ